MNVTNEWGANYYVLVGTKQLNSINAFTTAPYSNGGNVVFWIALNSQKQWGVTATAKSYTFTYPLAMSVCYAAVTGIKSGGSNEAGYNSVKVTSVSAKALSFYVSLEETASFFVIVFGKQLQWGLTMRTVGDYDMTVTYPLTFSSFSLPLAVPYGNQDTKSMIIKSISKNNFIVRTSANTVNSTGVTWCACGK